MTNAVVKSLPNVARWLQLPGQSEFAGAVSELVSGSCLVVGVDVCWNDRCKVFKLIGIVNGGFVVESDVSGSWGTNPNYDAVAF